VLGAAGVWLLLRLVLTTNVRAWPQPLGLCLVMKRRTTYLVVAVLVVEAILVGTGSVSFGHHPAGASATVAWLLAGVIIIPIAEEVLYRGLLFHLWSGSLAKESVAVVALSALWVSTHTQYDSAEKLSLFVVGLVLGAFRIRSGSLLSCILLHSILNLNAITRAM
jgi:membrane protease YdiL (CAAX protease family)